MRPQCVLTSSLALALAFVPAASSRADDYPSKPIRIVVPFAAGGGTDLIARLIAARIEAAWRQPAIVDNRPGAGGNIGTTQVARAATDGHTLLVTINSHAVNASLYQSPGYHPVDDFVAVSMIALAPNILAVHPSVPARTVRELVALAKSRPGQLTYGSGGTGVPSHLAGELLKAITGVALTHVPYKGIGPAVNDLLGGHVSMVFAAVPNVIQHARSGSLRAVAVTSLDRTPLAPELPTIAESGLPGFEVVSWFGMLAPGGTPADIVRRLNGEIAAAIGSADVSHRLLALGVQPRAMDSAEFAAYIAKDWAFWDRMIRAAGIRVE